MLLVYSLSGFILHFLFVHLFTALDLVFAEGIQSPWTTEFISFPLLDGGCEKSVKSENKVCAFYSCLWRYYMNRSMNHNSLGYKQPYITQAQMLKMKVTHCVGCISANTRLHQLRWGDREWAYYLSCARNTDDWPLMIFPETQQPSGISHLLQRFPSPLQPSRELSLLCMPNSKTL